MMNQPATTSGPRLPVEPTIKIDEQSYPTLNRWMSLNPREFKQALDELAALKRRRGTSRTTVGSIQAAVDTLAALYKNRSSVQEP